MLEPSLWKITFGLVFLGKLWIPLYSPPHINWIVPPLLFYKDGFGIKLLTNVDMPLNKEIETKINICSYIYIYIYIYIHTGDAVYVFNPKLEVHIFSKGMSQKQYLSQGY